MPVVMNTALFSVFINTHIQRVDGSKYRLLAIVPSRSIDAVVTPAEWTAGQWRLLSSDVTPEDLGHYELPKAGIADRYHPPAVDLQSLAIPAHERGFALARFEVVKNPRSIATEAYERR